MKGALKRLQLSSAPTETVEKISTAISTLCEKTVGHKITLIQEIRDFKTLAENIPSQNITPNRLLTRSLVS